MKKGYILREGTTFFAGGSYIYQYEEYPNISWTKEGAKVYKSRKRLENLLKNRKISVGGGWQWEIEEVDV